MVERCLLTGRLGNLLGVAVAVGEQDPVVDLGEGGPQVAAQFGDPVELVQPGGDDHNGDTDEAGREQPSNSPTIERRNVEPSSSLVLDERQRGDQKARQGEEHRDPDVAAGQPAESGVVEEHEHDGDGAHAVERRLIGESRSFHHVANVRRASASGLMGERPQEDARRRPRR